jgi:acetyltransferase-like isoleucine patch superfamily enzyme/acyl carrier protein
MTTATQTDTGATGRRADVHAALRALRPDLAEISDRDELHGLGLDSLDRIALAVSLERLTGRPIPDRDLANARTVADLLRCASVDQETATAAPSTAPAHTAPAEAAFGWVDPGGRVGVNTRLWHQAQIAPGARVGDHCTLGKGVFVGAGSVVGDRVKIGNGANLFGAIVDDDVMICPGVLLLEDPTPRATTPEGRPKGPADYQHRPVVVERGATIGAAAILAPGVTIGAHALVAVGAVVVRPVAAHALVAGNPARQCGWVCVCGHTLDDQHHCPVCARVYRQDGDHLAQVRLHHPARTSG